MEFHNHLRNTYHAGLFITIKFHYVKHIVMSMLRSGGRHAEMAMRGIQPPMDARRRGMVMQCTLPPPRENCSRHGVRTSIPSARIIWLMRVL